MHLFDHFGAEALFCKLKSFHNYNWLHAVTQLCALHQAAPCLPSKQPGEIKPPPPRCIGMQRRGRAAAQSSGQRGGRMQGRTCSSVGHQWLPVQLVRTFLHVFKLSWWGGEACGC